MKRTVIQWRTHQKRWQQFHRWEETLPPPVVPTQPTERLRWCEEALALHRRFSPPVSLALDAEQIRHWHLTRYCLPHRLPNRHGPA
jgi:hypothetical protein